MCSCAAWLLTRKTSHLISFQFIDRTHTTIDHIHAYIDMCFLAPDLNEETTEHAYVNVLTRGDLSSLRWISSPLGENGPKNSKVQRCRIYYSSLNFRDIMLATGKLPPDAIPGMGKCENMNFHLELE